MLKELRQCLRPGAAAWLRGTTVINLRSLRKSAICHCMSIRLVCTTTDRLTRAPVRLAQGVLTRNPTPIRHQHQWLRIQRSIFHGNKDLHDLHLRHMGASPV